MQGDVGGAIETGPGRFGRLMFYLCIFMFFRAHVKNVDTQFYLFVCTRGFGGLNMAQA